jgi:hypothetical protein
MGEWERGENGRMGEWENGRGVRMGEWENGRGVRMGEWENGSVRSVCDDECGNRGLLLLLNCGIGGVYF